MALIRYPVADIRAASGRVGFAIPNAIGHPSCCYLLLPETRDLWKLRNKPRIRGARCPGRQRPVCLGARTLKGPAIPKPAPDAEGRSRSFPRDRPVVYGRGTRRGAYAVIFLLSITPPHPTANPSRTRSHRRPPRSPCPSSP